LGRSGDLPKVPSRKIIPWHLGANCTKKVDCPLWRGSGVRGEDLSAELVRVGLAWWYRKCAPDDEELAKLEAESREAKRGVWADPDPVPPWEWRNARREERGRSDYGRRMQSHGCCFDGGIAHAGKVGLMFAPGGNWPAGTSSLRTPTNRHS